MATKRKPENTTLSLKELYEKIDEHYIQSHNLTHVLRSTLIETIASHAEIETVLHILPTKQLEKLLEVVVSPEGIAAIKIERNP